VRSLAAAVATYEFGNPTTTQTKRVRTSLRRIHLDRLEAIGAIQVTEDQVSCGPAFDVVFHVVAVSLTHARSPN
jgi:hypothetical protein